MTRQQRQGLVQRMPLPFSESGLLPTRLSYVDFHHILRYGQLRSQLHVLVRADRFTDQLASEACFFPGFVERRLLAGVARIDEALRNPPVLGIPPANQAQVD